MRATSKRVAHMIGRVARRPDGDALGSGVADVRSESLEIADTAVPRRAPDPTATAAPRSGSRRVELTGTERTDRADARRRGAHPGRLADSCGRRIEDRLAALGKPWAAAVRRSAVPCPPEFCRLPPYSSGTMAAMVSARHLCRRGRRGVRPGNDGVPTPADVHISERFRTSPG